MKSELTQARLKELLHYDPATGVFTWLVSRGRSLAGSRAGSFDAEGYRRIGIDGRDYAAHRLAFLYMVGEFPPADVDHANRTPGDNRWGNLRPATRRENVGNVGLRRDNTSGYRGVSRNRRNEKWQAYGALDGLKIHLGYFDSISEAASVAKKWREENFGIFAAA